MTTQQEQKWTKKLLPAPTLCRFSSDPEVPPKYRVHVGTFMDGHSVFEGALHSDATRIVSCWNFCLNHPDLEQVEICPKGTMEALRKILSVVEGGLVSSKLENELRSILARADKQNKKG